MATLAIWFGTGFQASLLLSATYLLVALILVALARLLNRQGSARFIAGLTFIILAAPMLVFFAYATPECFTQSCIDRTDMILAF